MSSLVSPVPSDVRAARHIVPVATVAAVLTGALAGVLAAGPSPVLAVLLPLPVLPILLWARPETGVYFIFTASVTVEQFPYTVADRNGAVTSQIPFFHTITPGSFVTPMEGLLGLVLAIWILQGIQSGRRLFHESGIGARFRWLVLVVGLYLLVGLARHGHYKSALWEIKPLLYLSAMFLLASAYITTTERLRVLLWIFVLGCAAKAAYGLVIFAEVRHAVPRPDAVLAHEESFFFGLFVCLVIGLWSFGVRGTLRRTATGLLPVVLMADMVNSRRTAWAVLICGSLLMAVVAYVRLPERRKRLSHCFIVVLAISAIYLPAYWNHTGSIAQPARAVRSVVSPNSTDARDSSSDKYRVIEDENLELNIRATYSAGKGFGVPIDYAIPMADLTGIASMLEFVPHDGVYWIWMRTGVVGMGVFLLVIAQAMISALRLTRTRDREIAAYGALVACAIAAYVIMGQKDLGFYWFRIACCMGVLLGAMEARIRAVGPEPAGAPAEPLPAARETHGGPAWTPRAGSTPASRRSAVPAGGVR